MIIIILIFIFLLLYTVIHEFFYVKKRKKIIPGAKFNNKDARSFNEIYWVEVIENDYLHFNVKYKIVGEEEIKDMFIRDFVKKYVP